MAIRLTESRLRQIIREEMEELASTGMDESDLEEGNYEWDEPDEEPPGRGWYPPENRSDGRAHYGAGGGDRSGSTAPGYEDEDPSQPWGSNTLGESRRTGRRTTRRR